MGWNPVQITIALWPVKNARPFLILAWVLFGVLIVGALIFAADTAVGSPESKASIPGITSITTWPFFGWGVLLLILTAVPLGLVLAFWAATTEAIAITKEVPEEYNVETSEPSESNVIINAPDNKGIIIGNNQGSVNIQAQKQPQLSLSQWKVTQLKDGNYQHQATLTSDIPATLPRVSFIARSASLISLKVMPSGGIGYSVVEGTVDGGRFMSFANVVPPYVVTAITKEPEDVNLKLSEWNPLDG